LGAMSPACSVAARGPGVRAQWPVAASGAKTFPTVGGLGFDAARRYAETPRRIVLEPQARRMWAVSDGTSHLSVWSTFRGRSGWPGTQGPRWPRVV